MCLQLTVYFKVFARATSTVGTGAEAKAAQRNVPVDFGGVTVHPVSLLPDLLIQEC
jgi:regulator of RNase E activity RraA